MSKRRGSAIPAGSSVDAALGRLSERGLLRPDLLARHLERGLGLRRTKSELLEEMRWRLAAGELAFASALVIRNLKAINQIYGYVAGDTVQALGEAVVELVLAELDPGARFGQLMGAHIVILHGPVERGGVQAATRRIHEAVAASVLSAASRTLRPRPEVATVAVPRALAYSVEDVLKMLDHTMRRAQRGHGPGTMLAGPEQARALVDLRARESSIDIITRALAERRIEVHIQPVVDLRSGGLHDGEALARIRVGDGFLAASDFIDAIYDLDEVVELDSQVLARILEAAPALARVGARLFANVSPLSLASPAFLSLLRQTIGELRRAGLHSVPVLELTEQSLLEHLPTVREIHRDLGVTFAVDDFGTGYSSLKTVADLAISNVISHLKIDGSLTRELPRSVEVYKVVLAVVNLARSLDLAVIAEQVDSEEILARVRSTGVELVQGNLLSAALPAATLVERWSEVHAPAVPSFSPSQLQVMVPYLDRGFESFYRRLVSGSYFATFFADERPIRRLVARQRQIFELSLTDSEDELRERYVRLGRLHHALLLPFPTVMRGAEMLGEELIEVLAHVTSDPVLMRNSLAFLTRLTRYMARGYLERVMREEGRELALLRHEASAHGGGAAVESLLACQAALLGAIAGDRPELLPQIEEEACPLSVLLSQSPRVSDAVSERIRRIHRSIHIGMGALAFFLDARDYTSVLLLHRRVSSRFLTLTALLLATTAPPPHPARSQPRARSSP